MQTVKEYIESRGIGHVSARFAERNPTVWFKILDIPVNTCHGIGKGGDYRQKWVANSIGENLRLERQIRLNSALSEENAQATFWHELCHALVYAAGYRPKRHHGREWQLMMLSLGQNPKRTVTESMSAELKAANPHKVNRPRRPRPFIYKCQDCGYTITRTRITARMARVAHTPCLHGRKFYGGRFMLIDARKIAVDMSH